MFLWFLFFLFFLFFWFMWERLQLDLSPCLSLDLILVLIVVSFDVCAASRRLLSMEGEQAQQPWRLVRQRLPSGLME